MIATKLNNIYTKGFGGFRLPMPDRLNSDDTDALQGMLAGMIDVDFEEKKVVFAPFANYNMISVSLDDDFLRNMAAFNSYLPLEKKDYSEMKKNFDVLSE